MKIFAFAASNSRKSINKQLVSYTLTYFDGYEKNLIDLNDYEMPIYGIDKENVDGIPEPAYRLASQIDESDLIICSFAEHNGAILLLLKTLSIGSHASKAGKCGMTSLFLPWLPPTAQEVDHLC